MKWFNKSVFDVSCFIKPFQNEAGLKNKVTGLTQPVVHLIKTTNKTNSKFGGKPMVNNHDFFWVHSGPNSIIWLYED